MGYEGDSDTNCKLYIQNDPQRLGKEPEELEIRE